MSGVASQTAHLASVVGCLHAHLGLKCIADVDRVSPCCVHSPYMQVYVTVPSQDVADTLAASIINQKLAACVNIIPGLQSVYFWEGKVAKDQELLLMIKTQSSLVPRLAEHVRKHHPYDEPEAIAVPITGGSSSYIQWIISSSGLAPT